MIKFLLIAFSLCVPLGISISTLAQFEKQPVKQAPSAVTRPQIKKTAPKINLNTTSNQDINSGKREIKDANFTAVTPEAEQADTPTPTTSRITNLKTAPRITATQSTQQNPDTGKREIKNANFTAVAPE